MKPANVTAPRRMGHLSRDARGYPIIATVDRDGSGANFGAIGERRKLALAVFDWCAVCGLPFGDEARWQVEPTVDGQRSDLSEGEIGFNEAPVHEICGIYAAQVCPFLSSPYARLGDEMRNGQRRWETVRMAAFRRTTRVEASKSDLQRDRRILLFAQTGLVEQCTYTRPEELSERYQALLADESDPAVSPPEQELIRLFAEISDAGDSVAGAALMAGGVFAPGIFRVLGFKIFDRDLYTTLAVALLTDEDVRKERAKHATDPATKAVAQWLDVPHSHPSEVLARWQDLGRGFKLRKGNPPPAKRPEGPGRSVPKNAPCPCGSGRRAHRCHPAGLAET